jgi:hypothetical protein
MKTPTSPAVIGEPVMRYPEDSDHFTVPHITITQNNSTGEKIARATVNGKEFEARHPYDGGRAAQALGEEIARLGRSGQLASGVIR